MRILIHGINYSPELTGIGKYTGEMAAWLAEIGHEVRVVTAPPYYPQWKVADGYSGKWYRKEKGEVRVHPGRTEVGSLTVYRCPLWVPQNPSGLKRILHLASFALLSFPKMLEQIVWRPDVVLVIEPPLFCAPQSWLVARLCGAKTWLHIQDFEIDAAFDLGILQAKLLRRMVLVAERFLLGRFDRVSTVSLNMMQKLTEKKVEKERAKFFPNWVDDKEIFPLSALSSYRAKLGVSEKTCVALYSGNMGEKQGLEVLVEAAKRTKEDNILFVLCGDGAARERLILQANNQKNILWLPLQPTGQLNELLNFADIHLLPQRAGLGELMMPSKLLGMLASGRPVVAMAEPDTQLANEVSKCGVVLAPGDTDGLTEAIDRLSKMPKERKIMGNAAREAAVKWGVDTILGEFDAELRRLKGARACRE